MCDASAAVWITNGLFVVANDEDNILRIYSLARTETPIEEVNLSSFLQIIPKHPEADLEGAARDGHRIYWIGSYGRNKDGKFRWNRHRFFMTRIEWRGSRPTLRPVGIARTDLLQWIQRISSLRSIPLDNGWPPKQGGVNIEGIAADGQGGVWIGFRSPLRHRRALVVHLLNPYRYLLSPSEVPRFAPVKWLDLGGLGIRGLTRIGKEEYLILAGPVGEQGTFALYLWDGKGEQPVRVPWSIPKQPHLHPESLLWIKSKEKEEDGPISFWVVSDDGTRRIDGKTCKKLSDPRQRRFRLVRMEARFPFRVR